MLERFIEYIRGHEGVQFATMKVCYAVAILKRVAGSKISQEISDSFRKKCKPTAGAQMLKGFEA
jgi:hypothetical protein